MLSPGSSGIIHHLRGKRNPIFRSEYPQSFYTYLQSLLLEIYHYLSPLDELQTSFSVERRAKVSELEIWRLCALCMLITREKSVRCICYNMTNVFNSVFSNSSQQWNSVKICRRKVKNDFSLLSLMKDVFNKLYASHFRTFPILLRNCNTTTLK